MRSGKRREVEHRTLLHLDGIFDFDTNLRKVAFGDILMSYGGANLRRNFCMNIGRAT
jgi:hypothetical protein